MKKLLLVCIILLIPMIVSAQNTIVQSTQFEWDDSNVAGLVEEFHMYCQEDTPGVVISPATLRATIAAPATTWTNDLTVGSWYCVVTAVIASASLESMPSNELAVSVVDLTAPTNLRIP